MKLKYPLLLRDKLVDILDYHHLTIGFCDEMKQKILERCIDLWIYISNSQIYQWGRNTELKEKLESMGLGAYDEATPIHKTILDRRFTIHRFIRYTGLLTILQDIDVIEVSDWYKVGHEAKNYKVKTHLLKGKLGDVIWMEPKNPIDVCIYKTKEEWIRSFPDERVLIQNHYLTHINIEALENDLSSLKVLGTINEKQYFHYLNLSLMFNQRYIWFARKDGRGRFYSSFSTLPKIVRKHITIDNLFVCQIDLKNALPLFISYKIDNKDFRKDCLEGIFWDKVSRHTNIERESVKKCFMREIVYNKAVRRTKLYVGLEELYPGLNEKIDEIKSRGDMFQKYTDLESKIFVDGMKTFDFPYLSIHDCIVVRNRERDRNRAVQALNYIFVSLGLEIPTFSVKCV